MANITLRQGYTSRYLITGVDANGAPFNYTDTTVELIVKSSSSSTTAALMLSLVVDAGGVATSTPAGRLALGRPNPVDLDGALVDTTAASGYITVRFAPEDSVGLAVASAVNFVWEARAVVPGDAYYLDSGKLTVEDSIFNPEVTP